ncbi:MAG: hypothetical protein ACR2QS_09160 [Woeseiaceae bacterium]
MTISKLAISNARSAVVFAALLLASTPSIATAEAWELRTTPNAVPGTHEIEAGKIDKAIRLSNAWLPHVAKKERGSVLTNLCIGYTLKKEFDRAEAYCDQAVEQSSNKTVSYNNRGVLKALQGDYEGAVQDFAEASNAGCGDNCSNAAPKYSQHPRAIAMRNFDRGEYQVNAAREDDVKEVAARTN